MAAHYCYYCKIVVAGGLGHMGFQNSPWLLNLTLFYDPKIVIRKAPESKHKQHLDTNVGIAFAGLQF